MKNDIMGFVKANKNVIAVVASSTLAGVIGIVGSSIWWSKKSKSNEHTEYTDLIRELERLGINTNDYYVSLAKRLTWMLEDSRGVYWRFPDPGMTFGDVLSDAAMKKCSECGGNPNDAITGFMVCAKKIKT